MKESKEFLLQRIGNYDLCGRTLGKGAFARVELANHRLTNTKVALKIIDLDKVKQSYVRKNVLRESAILKHLRHDNIVRLYETLAYHQTYCFATEYIEGGDLQTYLEKHKCLTEKQARKYFVQLLSAIQYLHWKGIMHRDLKMHNIMLTGNSKKLKLIDFGLSNFFNKEHLLKTHCGSAEYAAPELFEKGATYGASVEIWSMGVILYAMTAGRLPFQPQQNDKKENFVAQIRRGLNINHETSIKKLTPELRDLLSKMLEPDKDRRIDLSGILVHPWVSEKGKNPVLPSTPDILTHDMRQSVIERVSEIYSQPLGVTIEHLRANTHDSIDATYQILLEKTKYAHRASSRASSVSSKLLKKFCSKPCCENEQVEKKVKWNGILAEAKCKCPKEEDMENPISCCLKISTCSSYEKRSKTPPYARLEATSHDLKQTPFRLSPPIRHNNQGCPAETQHAGKKREPRFIETTIKNVSKENFHPSARADSEKQQAPIDTTQIRISVSGGSLKTGSFQIIEKSEQFGAAFIRRHCQPGDGKKNRKKGCIRCLSPFEARQMLHRNAFPLKKTLVKPEHQPKTVEQNNEQKRLCIQNKTGQYERKVTETKGKLYHKKSEVVATIISSPDSLTRWDKMFLL